MMSKTNIMSCWMANRTYIVEEEQPALYPCIEAYGALQASRKRERALYSRLVLDSDLFAGLSAL